MSYQAINIETGETMTVEGDNPMHPMPMSLWIATEGGRKCPQCGRYAKAKDLGFIGGRVGEAIVDMYGHKRGCK